jgi:DNA-directed RNA polymerase III subunit RPC8
VLEDFLADSRYANKLIKERGLALSVYDILTAEDGRVTWGNGQMYYKGGYSLQREAS